MEQPVFAGCFRLTQNKGSRRRPAAPHYFTLIVTVLETWPSTVNTTLDSPAPRKVKGKSTFT